MRQRVTVVAPRPGWQRDRRSVAHLRQRVVVHHAMLRDRPRPTYRLLRKAWRGRASTGQLQGTVQLRGRPTAGRLYRVRVRTPTRTEGVQEKPAQKRYSWLLSSKRKPFLRHSRITVPYSIINIYNIISFIHNLQIIIVLTNTLQNSELAFNTLHL